MNTHLLLLEQHIISQKTGAASIFPFDEYSRKPSITVSGLVGVVAVGVGEHAAASSVMDNTANRILFI
jgi:hypothetical protein